MSTFVYAQIAQDRQNAARAAADAKARGIRMQRTGAGVSGGEAGAAQPPTTGRYVEALAGLIPAEVLALHMLILSATTRIVNPKDPSAPALPGEIAKQIAGGGTLAANLAEAIKQAPTTLITSWHTLHAAFWGLVALSLLLYVVPRGNALWKNIEAPRSMNAWLRSIRPVEAVRAAIPPLSFIAWTMLQRATAFDAAYPDISEADRTVAGLFIAAIVIAVSTWVAFKLDPAPANGKDTGNPGEHPPAPAPEPDPEPVPTHDPEPAPDPAPTLPG